MKVKSLPTTLKLELFELTVNSSMYSKSNLCQQHCLFFCTFLTPEHGHNISISLLASCATLNSSVIVPFGHVVGHK